MHAVRCHYVATIVLAAFAADARADAADWSAHRDSAIRFAGNDPALKRTAEDLFANPTAERMAAFMRAAGERKREAADIVAFFLAHRSPFARVAAVWALEKEREAARGLAPRMLPLLKDRGPDIRWNTLRALGSLGNKDVADAVALCTEDSVGCVRWMAAQTLGKLGGARHAPHVAGLLRDRDENARLHAALALGTLTGQDWKPWTADLVTVARRWWEEHGHRFETPDRKRTVGEPHAPQAFPVRLLRRIDRDGDGKISRREAPPRMRRRWDSIDTNGNGYVELAELEARERRRRDQRLPPRDGPAGPSSNRSQKTGLLLSTGDAFEGYTLLAPMGDTTTCLIDNDGRTVHSWRSRYRPGSVAYLLPSGNLLRSASMGRRPGSFPVAAAGGRVELFGWDGELLWDYQYVSEQHLLHHDLEMLPNGNVLMIAWQKKSRTEAIASGRNPALLRHGRLLVDEIIEVRPTGRTGGEIVWRWSAWNHLIQDFDASKRNYGNVAEHPERIDVNHVAVHGPVRDGSDWTHINSVDYNADLDQILLTVHGFNEIWIIDHSPRSRQPGLLYRWGNPRAHRAGTRRDQRLFRQHDAAWIEKGLPGAGHILLFNNGPGRPDGNYSSVIELLPPVTDRGAYQRPAGGAFGPEAPLWEYVAPRKADFFSQNLSGAQRLPNGNTLVCSGSNGTLFEVTAAGQMVWKYVIPPVVPARPGGMVRRWTRYPGFNNNVFRAHRYPLDYAAFRNRTLAPKGPAGE